LNKLRTEPWIPNQDERRVIKMLWSIVWKAADTVTVLALDPSLSFASFFVVYTDAVCVRHTVLP